MNQYLPLLVLSVGCFLWLCSDACQKMARVRSASRIAESKTAFLKEHGATIVQMAESLGILLCQSLGIGSPACTECNTSEPIMKCLGCGALFNRPEGPGELIRCPNCTSVSNHSVHH